MEWESTMLFTLFSQKATEPTSSINISGLVSPFSELFHVLSKFEGKTTKRKRKGRTTIVITGFTLNGESKFLCTWFVHLVSLADSRIYKILNTETSPFNCIFHLYCIRRDTQMYTYSTCCFWRACENLYANSQCRRYFYSWHKPWKKMIYNRSADTSVMIQ